MATTAQPTDHEASNSTVADASVKRKREDDAGRVSENATLRQSQRVQRDLLTVLEHHAALTATQPSQKKVRLSEPESGKASIASKLRNGSYLSLEQIKVDADLVSGDLVSTTRAKSDDSDGANQGRLSVDELKSIRKIQAFETLIKQLVDQEIQYDGSHALPAAGVKGEEAPTVNGHGPDKKIQDVGDKSGTVLTLFGNAPTPKQLFSSMQDPSVARRAIRTELPVEEMSLPNGIQATKVLSSGIEEGASKGPTFEEAFAPPYSLAALAPPRAYKRASTTDNIIAWEFKDPVQRNKRGGYTVQPLTTGMWLGYGGAEPGGDGIVAREKRKQRDRALSAGEGSHPDMSPTTYDEALAKEEEALFRRAYSSFAPNSDNASSVVPVESKNAVWWHKEGEQRFNRVFALDPALADDPPAPNPFGEPSEQESPLDIGDLGRLLEELDELCEATQGTCDELESLKSRTDVEQVLQDISVLLESLASYQRIRNVSLTLTAAVPRPPISPDPTQASKGGTPGTPSEDEVATYERLRRELAYLVLQLPPYALAKLDGDQWADLNVSKLIKFYTKDARGIMEEDQVSRSAKLAAMATANSIASLTRPNSSAGQHYSTTAQRTPAIGQAANTRYGQQYGPRPPAVPPSYQRTTSNQPTYGTPSAATPRPGLNQGLQYSRPAATSGYGLPNQQYYQRPTQQTPSASYGGYNQQYQQQMQRPAYQAQQASQYQTNYSAQQQQQQSNRTTSPAKVTGYNAPTPTASIPQVGAQPRPGYSSQLSNSGRATPVSYPSQPQTPVNGVPAARPPPVAPRPASTTPQPAQSVAGAPAGAPSNGSS